MSQIWQNTISRKNGILTYLKKNKTILGINLKKNQCVLWWFIVYLLYDRFEIDLIKE